MLRVENTGHPVPPELLPTLTEPFQRGTQRVRTDEHAGVGLGLAIVNSIVQAHAGTLDLAPRPTGGLRVTIRLPHEPGSNAVVVPGVQAFWAIPRASHGLKGGHHEED
ncbi:sensor histidine kinase [Actinomadura madurae]|uniref:sensor histidine kinase n=1 Tax=Actinomadura madurae TaxID=1993 RepID=UPI0027E36EDB|nr:ATP-binding protein [Actinomadura madurae]